jgi:glycosyltransferase involved in cell wall biosynthesis
MRITVLASSYPRFEGDGTAPFVQSLAEHLATLGHDVEVIAPYDPEVQGTPGSLVAVHRFRYAIIDRWHIMGHARSLAGDNRLRLGAYLLLPLFLLSEFGSALRTARRQRAEIIHAHWVIPNGLAGAWVARLLGIPLAVSLHGSDIFVAQRSPLFGWVARWVFRHAAVVTSCGEHLRQAAIALGAAADKVHLVAWGADPDRFAPPVAPLERSEFGLAADDVVLVSLGRIVPKKGFDVLVRTLPSLLRAHTRVKLVIGGEGNQREELARLAASQGVEGHIRLPGRIPWHDVPAFLAMGDIFVLPSVIDAAGNVDGLPTVLLEAMAMNKPVVATEIGGVPLVIEHGVNGLLVPPGNTERLAQAVSSLLGDEDLRIRLGSAARWSVERDFNWTEVARRMSSLFESVVAG